MFPSVQIPPSIADEGQSYQFDVCNTRASSVEDIPDCPTTNLQREHIPLMDDATVDNVAEMLLHDKIICVCQVKVM